MKPLLIILLLLSLSACGRLGFPGVYKIPIEQGNIITYEMVEKLKPGMTKSQVEYILGTPLIKDSFDSNRWDYQYRLYTDGNLVDQYKLAVFFADGRIVDYKSTVKTQKEIEDRNNRLIEKPQAKKIPWYKRWFRKPLKPDDKNI